MKRVFADTLYWIAIVNHRDQWFSQAMSAVDSLESVTLVTTEEVLGEFLAHYSGHGSVMRDVACRTVERILSNPQMVVRPQTHRSFLEGLSLYKSRPDKGYSLTDCISMQAMRQEKIEDILTGDAHFTQEGFSILL